MLSVHSWLQFLHNLLQNLLDSFPNGLLYKGLFTAVMVGNS